MFQFPSNGKAYHKMNLFAQPCHAIWISFNSLQTGKRITRFFPYSNTKRRWQKVSIPFKRESVSQAGRRADDNPHLRHVSIPFKRESVSQEARGNDRDVTVTSCFNSLQTGKRITSKIIHLSIFADLMFQFPSNGKAYHKQPNVPTPTRCHRKVVSIPFKRESVSQEKLTAHHSLKKGDFVSIPFKRESVSQVPTLIPLTLPLTLVSIPFKRESVSQVRAVVKGKRVLVIVGFQFPSNGKAYHKWNLHSHS